MSSSRFFVAVKAKLILALVAVFSFDSLVAGVDGRPLAIYEGTWTAHDSLSDVAAPRSHGPIPSDSHHLRGDMKQLYAVSHEEEAGEETDDFVDSSAAYGESGGIMMDRARISAAEKAPGW